jgi:hypothetical protein
MHCSILLARASRYARGAIFIDLKGDEAMDLRLSTEELEWLRKLRDARLTKRPSPDIPTSVVRRLTMLACAEARGGGQYGITLRGRDELIDRELANLIR